MYLFKVFSTSWRGESEEAAGESQCIRTDTGIDFTEKVKKNRR